MKKILEILRDNHEYIFKVFLFIATIAIIVSVFPKEGKFKYEFTKGRPWMHNDLIASFDFAIKKSAEEIQQEEQAIRETSPIFFRLDTVVALNMINFYQREFAVLWNKKYEEPGLEIIGQKSNKQQSFKVGRNIVQEIYNRGIIEMIDAVEGKPQDFEISLLIENMEEERVLRDFLTIQTAYNYAHNELLEHKNIDIELLILILDNALEHNIKYDDQTTRNYLNQQIANISIARGKIQQGERIISKGELIDSEKYRLLESYREEYLSQTGGVANYMFIVIGQVLLVTLSILILFFFLFLFRKDIMANNIRIAFILLITMLMVFMATISIRLDFIVIYALPFGILPIVIRAFYDTRLALFTHLVNCLIIGFIAPNGFEFMFIQVLAGIFAVFSIVNMSKRSQLFLTAFIIFCSYSLSYIGFAIMEEGNVNNLNPSYFGYFAISSMLTLFAYPLIYLFEKIFGFISDVTLIELSDTNSPLLRELAMRAPGTLQHSLQVANLAEEAIFSIGGDSLLVRAGALYHDIGKMDNPRYFIENQTTGINPHDELNFDESAAIIISHIIKGVERAKKYNLPEKIIDFIRTHHGDSMVQYFYRSYIKQFPEKIGDEKKFRYPGPRPFSKETAVLMMADSVEAASRSLKVYDNESIDNLVEKIIDSQIADKQFVNADITFKDITVIKKIFKKKLLTVYHVRIEYPR
jgi:cyclic-di-AMP phosphodiesterase PgpH